MCIKYIHKKNSFIQRQDGLVQSYMYTKCMHTIIQGNKTILELIRLIKKHSQIHVLVGLLVIKKDLMSVELAQQNTGIVDVDVVVQKKLELKKNLK